MKKTAFTLVELIVVITILAILATIGFVSFSGYLAGTRDTNRIAQLKSMSDALELYRTKKDLPIPDDKVDVQANGTTIAYQGYIGANVLETIEYTEKGLDPKDKVYFSYYLTKNKKYFQLLSFLEEANTDLVASNIINNLQAVDYSGRFPKVTGKKLGILTGTGTDLNTPIQEIAAVIASGYLDIVTTTDTYNSVISDDFTISGDGTKLAVLESMTLVKGKVFNNCKSILEDNSNVLSKDGLYIISLGGEFVEVYCDMTTDGGGWTFFGHFNGNSDGRNFFEGGTGIYKANREDDETKYSLGVDDFNHTEMMAILDKNKVGEYLDPIVADAGNRLVFYKYEEGHLGFNKGPVGCQDLNSYSYKTAIGGLYTPNGTSNYCQPLYWYSRTAGNAGYLVSFHTSAIGIRHGGGMGGDNAWGYDGWWYLR